ncbi:ATP-dependent RecD-like DNA helicase [Streptococcus sp. sy018]|uniref:ATP-dependent DNA helicase n=1 Tax=Streptococcus sp. sy018 TaxID=2600147 RepID=UPI0011B3A36E|nr:AAA family ATPase [Streptococcus sp. sy018]TWS94583.1 AAA family ATPase [Streptococcus sp. sy018]
MKIDKPLLDIDCNICKNIESILINNQRGFFSQNILNVLRNFVEHISIKIYNYDKQCDLNWEYASIEAGMNYIKSRGEYRFIAKFHKLLQLSVSHYTLDEGNAERLILKYYEYLLRIKNYMRDTFDFEVLHNLNLFPLYQDTISEEYYSKIVTVIDNPTSSNAFSERYYIQKIKPFFVNQKIYYEVTYTITQGDSSKFDRIIAYTDKEILSNYATKLWLKKENIEIYGEQLPILVVANWEVSVRPCEFNTFKKILKLKGPDITTSHKEYQILMAVLKLYNMNFIDIIDLSAQDYNRLRDVVRKKAQVLPIFDILDVVRDASIHQLPGVNVLRYLLFYLNNKILKNQYYHDRYYLNKCNGGNRYLSEFRLHMACIPFDEMPFCTSLRNHNPKLYDLLECIDTTNREHEFLARLVKNNTEVRGLLYTPLKEIKEIYGDNADVLINEYNSKLYKEHRHRSIISDKGHAYLSGYENNVIAVIKKLQDFSVRNNRNHSQFVRAWLDKENHNIDDEFKKEKLVTLFEHSAVSLIYGAAGTGKTYFLNHIAQLFNSSKKLFLAITHTAVENLRRRITAANCEFGTIASTMFVDTECDILFVDECSTVSNDDINQLFDKIKARFVVLVGDIYQIESIQFGNWFTVARDFIKPEAIVELEKPYRTTDVNLLEIWSKFRKLDDDILEYLARYNYNYQIDNTLFQRDDSDEIILSLNYDGIYGINNINRMLQAVNPNPSIEWNSKLYKVGDPIVFNDSTRFKGVLYNNLKGVIRKIEIQSDDSILFDVELIDKQLSGVEVDGYELELVDDYQDISNSVVRFWVNKYRSTDEDIDDNGAIVPFQISYCISIHRAQGLEYNSVKIIINKEIDEQITHNIFYTAITRTKNYLKIYWSPETSQHIIGNLQIKQNNKDRSFIEQKLSS